MSPEQQREACRIGVWEEGGIIFSRTDEKQHSPRRYAPKNPANLERVLDLARSLYYTAIMNSWTAQTEAQYDETFIKMKDLAEIS